MLVDDFKRCAVLTTAVTATLLETVEGCFRKSPRRPVEHISIKEPEDHPDTDYTYYSSMSTTPVQKTFPCTEDERQVARCLNGGECFVVDTGTTGCHCPEEFTGIRCEQLYISLHSLDMQKAGFTLGAISVFVVLLLVTLVILYVYLKYKKRQRQESSSHDPESEALTKKEDSLDGLHTKESHKDTNGIQEPPMMVDETFKPLTSELPLESSNLKPAPSPVNQRPPELDRLSGSLRKAKSYNRASVVHFIDDDDIDE